jgi:hypothetical protein
VEKKAFVLFFELTALRERRATVPRDVSIVDEVMKRQLSRPWELQCLYPHTRLIPIPCASDVPFIQEKTTKLVTKIPFYSSTSILVNLQPETSSASNSKASPLV